MGHFISYSHLNIVLTLRNNADGMNRKHGTLLSTYSNRCNQVRGLGCHSQQIWDKHIECVITTETFSHTYLWCGCAVCDVNYAIINWCSEERVWSSEGRYAVQDPRIPGENAVLSGHQISTKRELEPFRLLLCSALPEHAISETVLTRVLW